jgi:hypothetical protein
MQNDILMQEYVGRQSNSAQCSQYSIPESFNLHNTYLFMYLFTCKRFYLCKILGFHGVDYEECRLL